MFPKQIIFISNCLTRTNFSVKHSRSMPIGNPKYIILEAKIANEEKNLITNNIFFTIR